MKNLFSNIVIFDNATTYALGQRVIYNHELYLSKVNGNNSLPSTGNTSVDDVLKLEFTKTISSTNWTKI